MKWTPLALALALSGCPVPEEPAGPESRTELLAGLRFGREAPEGVATVGFDLDGVTSTGDGPNDCGIADLVHEGTGEPGIDNSFGSSLLPALESIGGQAIEDLLRNSILDGELLIMIELDGVDDPMNDDCVGLTISRGVGVPRIGGDGEILPGQTYDRHLEIPTSVVECAVLEDGIIRASGFTVRLVLNIFDEAVDLTLLDGVIEFPLAAETIQEATKRGAPPPPRDLVLGAIGGGILVQEIKEFVATLDGIGDQIPALIGPLLDLNADLAPTPLGTCTQLSVAMEFEAIGAFFFE